MATKTKATAEKPAEATVDYPKRWVFDSNDQGKADWVDGPLCDGSFARFEAGRTEYGEKPIAILNVAGVERSVWLIHDALYNRFRDELLRRSMPKLVADERVVIRKHQEKTRSKNDRDYVGYDVFFLDAPAPDEEKLFNLGPSTPAPTEETSTPAEAKPGPDDDVPF